MKETLLTKGIRIYPVESERKLGRFDLGKYVLKQITNARLGLQDGDILVISSKFAAMAEGRFIRLSKVRPSRKTIKLAKRFSIDPKLAELVLQESDAILGGIPGFLLAVSRGIIAPNAGIDRSNVPKGHAILYPKDPNFTAEELFRFLSRSTKRKVGVILSDSRITPGRVGTIGIAIASSGFNPVEDERGKEDLFGNKLKVTMKAVADQIASAAELAMGEASESVPIALVRGYNVDFGGTAKSMIIPYSECLYIQGLKNSY
ncbi:MAG: coenzyme F420-0:L-glutamate ligase [Nitrososphaerales archaeon]